jgi:hypothetical protein
MGAPEAKVHEPESPQADTTTFSNSIRLTGREWLIVGLFAVLLPFLPDLWKRWEPVAFEPDYRIPDKLTNDYWLFERVTQLAVENCDTFVLGDSVVWGVYAGRQETLSHYLQQLSPSKCFANLGVNGAHPLALTGLIEHYATGITGKIVILQCNPLWLSSRERDLQVDKTTEFNHPRLVPQFYPWIPSYKDEISQRIGVAVEHHFPLNQWTSHLQQAYYEQTDIPSWTLEHPYDNPFRPLTQGLPPSDDAPREMPLPWRKSGKTKQDFPWIDLDTSLQWQAFQRAVKVLQERGNRVFVLVGPLNEHMLIPGSLERYAGVKATIAAWLTAQQIPHAVPPVLASDQYGDASHPLAAGYEELARQLLREPFFSGQ